NAAGQGVVAVDRKEHRAVDVTAGGVLLEAGAVVVVADDDEEQLATALGGGRLGAAEHPGEERVGEEPLPRLRDDEGERVAAAGDERPRGLAGHVGEPGRRGAHGLAGAVADAGVTAEDPAGGGARDARAGGDRVEGRSRRTLWRHHRARPSRRG